MDGREDPCEFSLLTEELHLLGCSRLEGEALLAPGYLAHLQAGPRSGSRQVIVAALSVCTRIASGAWSTAGNQWPWYLQEVEH